MPIDFAAGYDALASAYADRLWHELDGKPFDRDFLRRFATEAPAGKILDLGCGPGQIARFVADLGRPAIGIDISPGMIREANARNPGMQFHIADMRSTGLPDASLAGIVAFYSIIHLTIDEIPAALAEMKRLLMPGGLAAISFHTGDHAIHVEELWGTKTSLDFHFHSPDRIQARLVDDGFEIVECETRSPYAPEVEAQTTRCYLKARVGRNDPGI